MSVLVLSSVADCFNLSKRDDAVSRVVSYVLEDVIPGFKVERQPGEACRSVVPP